MVEPLNITDAIRISQCRLAARKSHHKNYLINKDKINQRNKNYKLLNEEKLKIRRHNYYTNNKDKIVAQNKRYYILNKEKKKIYHHNHYLKNKDKIGQRMAISASKYHFMKKLDVISYYSNNKNECAKCGFKDMRALSIDHINGGGRQHTKLINGNLYLWLINNNHPNGFQVLCMNCQYIKRTENNELRKRISE